MQALEIDQLKEKVFLWNHGFFGGFGNYVKHVGLIMIMCVCVFLHQHVLCFVMSFLLVGTKSQEYCMVE